MAKRSKIEQVIYYGYDNGIWHSTIFHCIVLILLSLVLINIPVENIKPIILTFSNDNVLNFNTEPEVALSLDFSESIDHRSDELSLPNIDINIEQLSPDFVMEQEDSYQAKVLDVSDIDPRELMDKVAIKQPVANTTPSNQDVGAKSPKKSNKKSGQSSSTANFLSMISNGAKLAEGIPPGTLVNNGSGSGEMDHRLRSYGAQTGDIQVSLMWNTTDDIDLHVDYYNGPQRDTINWRNRYGRSGGILDIDMNARGPSSNQPIENIFWPYNTAPSGNYVISVHFFRSWSRNVFVPVVVKVKTLKGEMYFNAVVRLGQPPVEITALSN